MIECFNTEFKEQLPELAAGTLDAGARALVMQHVSSCAACAEELEILHAVRAAQVPVPFINVPRIVRALPPAPIPVRAELPWYRRASIQMAAAFLLVAGGLIAVRQAGDRISAASNTVAVTPAKTDIALASGFDEMTTDELTSLLKDVDALAAVPLAEPEQFSPVNATSDNQGEG